MVHRRMRAGCGARRTVEPKEGTRVALSPSLVALAERHGVATSYRNYAGEPREVPEATVRAVLRAMGVEGGGGLGRGEVARLVARTSVVRAGRPRAVRLLGGAGALPAVELTTEAGERHELALRSADGGGLEAVVPDAVPAGYHRLSVRSGGLEQQSFVILAPERCPGVPAGQRLWGWMVQLYAARSRRSWGIGDVGDLGELCARSARELGADFALCSPLHASNPTVPQQPSPYYPSSRRFRNPLYLRIDALPEFEAFAAREPSLAAQFAGEGRALNEAPRIGRDEAYELKLRALETLFAQPRLPAREAAYAAFREREGRGLVDFATFCALAEEYGLPYQAWPRALRHPANAEVAPARGALHERVELHSWVQWLCDEQLAETQRAATEAGMRVGVIHDLAVGVDAGGADAWSLQDELAQGMKVGAPPDSFNQRGQDWGLPPWRPDRLEATAFAPYRDMVRTLLRHAGGIRIDHALGLFRLFWVPEGASPREGTYVRYPADALLAILAVESERAGAVVVAEDLGTVEAPMVEAMRDWGLFGSAVLWFEREEAGAFRAPREYRRQLFTSVTTHDLPTPAGYWTGEALRVQQELGLLGDDRDPAEEARTQAAERAQLLAALEAEGLVGPRATLEDGTRAVHAYVARTPSALVAIGLADALGERRQPNMPATTDEYPNWRIPLSRPGTEGEPEAVYLEDALEDRRLRAVVEAVRAERGRAQPSGGARAGREGDDR